MLQVAAGRPVVAVLAAAALILCHEKAPAQDADPMGELEAPLDPSAPLAPLPDLGVEWPDMEAEAGEDIADTPDTDIADATGERGYSVRIEGLEAAPAEDLLAQFGALSTLEENRDDPANAAQIDRRAREDADLLAELLRAHGFYDAMVDTGDDGAGVASAGAGGARLRLRRSRRARHRRRPRDADGDPGAAGRSQRRAPVRADHRRGRAPVQRPPHRDDRPVRARGRL